MTAASQIEQTLPTGTWALDSVHSSIGFEIAYMVGSFRGTFREVDAQLQVSDHGIDLHGAAKVASVDVKDENLAAHLQSPDFFDAERHPQLRFESTAFVRNGDTVTLRGEITIKGITQPVELTGTTTDAITDPYGRERFGLELRTTVDRTAFGVSWNTPLPSGEPALADEVAIDADLYFVRA
jgi:polyisoprenoid-binding protein YceI